MLYHIRDVITLLETVITSSLQRGGLITERLGLWCLMPLSTIFLLYRGGKFD